MNPLCRNFRLRLEEALRGHPSRGVPPELSWHEHLLACAGCRDLLEAEEALEQVLATLPAPKLPPRLTERVLERLRVLREAAPSDRLDRLLDLARAPQLAPPAGLGQRVLDGLRTARREAALDELLERVPAPEVPPDLAARVLAGVAARRRPRPVLHFMRSHLVQRSAAAVLVLGLGFAAWRGMRRPETVTRSQPLAAFGGDATQLPSEDLALLEALDVLENWELLNSTEVDVLLADFDSLEAELLELEEPADEPEPPAAEVKHG